MVNYRIIKSASPSLDRFLPRRRSHIHKLHRFAGVGKPIPRPAVPGKRHRQ